MFSRHEFQSSPPEQLLISSGAQGMLILAVNVRGWRSVEREERRRVQSSLQKQPASTVEERTGVFNNASRSAVTSENPPQQFSSAPRAHGTVGGDLPAITTSFPEFH